jgi:hypothetical protein
MRNITFGMTTLRCIIVLSAMVLLCGEVHAQSPAETNFYDQIKKYDLSTILIADSILTEDGEDSKDKIKRAEILGFIGNDFQRFHIHFISIIQDPTNPYQYMAYGKTMVKETICSFQGKILVQESSIHKSADMPDYKQGSVLCDVTLYEDKKQSSTGVIKGKLTIGFIVDDKNSFRYDALWFVADGFNNNRFIGSWTSYKTHVSKKCNWGDYRIPECGDLDVGAGEFMVSEEYIKNGWVGYMLENKATNLSVSGATGSKKKENAEWWK